MGVKTSSKNTRRKTSSKKTPLMKDAPETKYQCKKCKRKITVLVDVSSVWCNRCSNVMQPI